MSRRFQHHRLDFGASHVGIRLLQLLFAIVFDQVEWRLQFEHIDAIFGQKFALLVLVR